jgi:hypothetical protein
LDFGARFQKDNVFLGAYTAYLYATPFGWELHQEKMCPLWIFEGGYTYHHLFVGFKTLFSETSYEVNANLNRYLSVKSEAFFRDRLYRYGAGVSLYFKQLTVDYFYSASIIDLETIGVNYMGLRVSL